MSSDAPDGREGVSRSAVRSGTEKRRRYRNLTIRLLPAERDAVEADAARAGMTLGSYVRDRMALKTQIRTVRRAPIEAVMLAQLLGQVGKVGGNIHQIIRRVNFGEGVPRQEIDAAIVAWRAVAAAIMEALGKGRGHADGD